MRRICDMALTLLVAWGLAGPLAAQSSQPAIPIYTPANAPAAPALDALPRQASVAQYGITWTFEAPAPVGQFVNGDFYVVGPVTIKTIDPAPRSGADLADAELDPDEKKLAVDVRTRNGSVLNPPAKQKVGWDSGTHYHLFDKALVARLPIALQPGDCLASSISLKQGEKVSFVYHSTSDRKAAMGTPAKVAAVLTCLAEPQPADAFRPGYADRQQKIYLARQLKRAVLPSLARVANEPDPAKLAEIFQKPWFNTAYFEADQPALNMPRYGQWIGQAVGAAGLVLCSDYPAEEKERLLINFVQVGLDYWSLVKNGHFGWESWGGHNSGRKLPIVLAGHLLGDEAMAAPSKAFPQCNFGEDNQTAYGECWTGAKVVFTGHSGIQADGKVTRAQWGPYEHLTPAQWQLNGLNGSQSEAYRRCCTSNCWVGQALTLRILKLERQWDHDAFFDYVDRWMTEDDKPARAQMTRELAKPLTSEDPGKEWAHQGFTNEPWVKTMWNQYRSVSPAPTDGWKQVKANANGLVLPPLGKLKEAKPAEKPTEKPTDR